MSDQHYTFLKALCATAMADPFAACRAEEIRDALGMSDSELLAVVAELHARGLAHRCRRVSTTGPNLHITPEGVEYVLQHEA